VLGAVNARVVDLPRMAHSVRPLDRACACPVRSASRTSDKSRHARRRERCTARLEFRLRCTCRTGALAAPDRQAPRRAVEAGPPDQKG
jgi:hypothetical protein